MSFSPASFLIPGCRRKATSQQQMLPAAIELEHGCLKGHKGWVEIQATSQDMGKTHRFVSRRAICHWFSMLFCTSRCSRSTTTLSW
jgi:hypothetical protein